MAFSGVLTDRRLKRPPSLKPVTLILQWWTWHSYTLPTEDPKNIQSLSSADITIFSLEISNFCYIKTYKCRLHFNVQFLILLLFFSEFLNVVFINMVAILMVSAKLDTLGHLKVKVFWNKGHDIVNSVYDITNKILSGDSNSIVDVVMWPKFDVPIISMRKVVITSIL